MYNKYEIKLKLLLFIECSDKHCKQCPNDKCTECYTSYYLFDNSSCLTSCPSTSGYGNDTDNGV